MKLFRVVSRSINNGFHHQFNRSMSVWPGIPNSNHGLDNIDNQNPNSAESTDDFQRRMFGDVPELESSSFLRALDMGKKGRSGQGTSFTRDGDGSEIPEGLGGAFPMFTDGMDEKLKKAAETPYFEVDPQEIASDDYTYRPDMNFKAGMTYTPQDLNMRTTGIWKPNKKPEFEVTTKEALEKADFRNVRFLANFITEAGLIVKRNKTGISAKAQRKIAREINTARAFGLLPFTTMGTKSFVFGRTMENLSREYELDPYDIPADVDNVQDPIAE